MLRTNLEHDAKKNWSGKQAERKKNLRQRYAKALSSVGSAQKKASSLQRNLRLEAKEQLGAWSSTNEQHRELHVHAVSK